MKEEKEKLPVDETKKIRRSNEERLPCRRRYCSCRWRHRRRVAFQAAARLLQTTVKETSPKQSRLQSQRPVPQLPKPKT